MKKKIFILVRRLDKGGAEMLECRLAVQLVSHGYETFLGAQYSAGHFSGYEKAAHWKEKGVREVLFLNAEGIFGSIAAVFNIIRFQRVYNFDAIISSNTGLQTLTGFAALCIPICHVAAFHDYLTPTRNRSFRVLLWKKLISRIDVGYAITDYVKRNISSRIQTLQGKIFLVYNSIDETKLLQNDQRSDIRSELNLPKHTKLIVYVGRLNYRKGLDVVVDYLGKWLLKWNACILVLGEKIDVRNLDYGKFDFQALLKEKIEEMGITDRVYFLGFRPDAFSIMCQSTLLAHLARHEGFGLIFIEAFAARLPIVATDVGGIPEVLKEANYRSFDIKNEAEIIEEVDNILNMTDDERRVRVARAFNLVPSFSDQRRARDISNILKQLM